MHGDTHTPTSPVSSPSLMLSNRDILLHAAETLAAVPTQHTPTVLCSVACRCIDPANFDIYTGRMAYSYCWRYACLPDVFSTRPFKATCKDLERWVGASGGGWCMHAGCCWGCGRGWRAGELEHGQVIHSRVDLCTVAVRG